MDYEFINDFKSNKHLSLELNQLIKRNCARSTLDDWMLKGHSDQNYQYYGLVDLRGNLVAAVGLIKTSIYYRRQRYNAIQLGNVYFHEPNDFSPFDKSRIEHELLSRIVSKFDTIVDVIYYYHDQDNKPLLEDFGLTPFPEYNYYLELDPHQARRTSVIKRVTLDNANDYTELLATIKHSYQVSKNTFDISSDSIIKLYNILKYFRRSVYKIPSLEVTVVCEFRGNTCKIIAIFAKNEIDLTQIINAIVPQNMTRVEFGFTPCNPIPGLKCDVKAECKYETDNLTSSKLYVKAITLNLEASQVQFPVLSRQK